MSDHDRSGRIPRVGFVGSMNAMPMGYALRFIEDGFDVKYSVEAAPQDFLGRPEHHFARAIDYPYPPWIVEAHVPYTLAGHAFAARTYRRFIETMADRDVLFLNDFGLALAPHFRKSAMLIALSSGSDIDVLCSYSAAWHDSLRVRRKWLAPAALVLNLLRTRAQRRGLDRVAAICYFPRGLNAVGDRIIDEFTRRRPGVKFVPRYDVNFQAIDIRQEPVRDRSLMKILVPVRFNIEPAAGSAFEYKGNDRIIEALGRYRSRNPAIKVLFFRKGVEADLQLARRLCSKYGIADCVEWLDPLPLPELLKLYYDCDVCIDQVGSHWMGAIGAYALYAGRPLIANWRPDVFGAMWGTDVPILQATTAPEIHDHLVRCEDIAYRRDLAERGHRFAVRCLSGESTYQQLKALVLASHAERRNTRFIS